MNNSSRMTEVECFEKFVDVVAYISIGELFIREKKERKSSIAEKSGEVKKRRKRSRLTFLLTRASGKKGLGAREQLDFGRE